MAMDTYFVISKSDVDRAGQGTRENMHKGWAQILKMSQVKQSGGQTEQTATQDTSLEYEAISRWIKRLDTVHELEVTERECWQKPRNCGADRGGDMWPGHWI